MGLFDKFKKKPAPAETPAEQPERHSPFLGFALLADESWDKAQFIEDLREEWGVEAIDDGHEDSLVFPVGNMMASVAMMPAPVPNGEAEHYAAANYMWPKAVETTKAHQAHIMVAVLGAEPDIIKKGELFSKLMSCCCKQKNILGVYASGTVFEPRFYIDAANMMKSGNMPILTWIWFGLYRRDGGVCCYTYGMEQFGKDEMEVLDASAQPSDVRDFLLTLTAYVLESGVTLKDGETIGFSQEDKHPITRSEGVSLPGMTLKIGY